MDSDLWISRLAAAKRFYASQFNHTTQSDRAGLDEFEVEEEMRPEFACPYCYEDHDVASLCAHLEEEHPFEPNAAPCPICSDKITRDMLNHITLQHGHLVKSRRRLRRYIIPGSQAISLLSRDFREAHLQVLLGSGGHRSNNNATATNISTDPLLSSFGLSFPTSDVEETSKSSMSTADDVSVVKKAPTEPWESSVRVEVMMQVGVRPTGGDDARSLTNRWFTLATAARLLAGHYISDSSLTSEEREQKRKRASVRATFVQDLLLSTLFGD